MHDFIDFVCVCCFAVRMDSDPSIRGWLAMNAHPLSVMDAFTSRNILRVPDLCKFGHDEMSQFLFSLRIPRSAKSRLMKEVMQYRARCGLGIDKETSSGLLRSV